jgi:hypothetical protein
MNSKSLYLPQFQPMRLKTRGLAQHGGPPGWLEESAQAGCGFVRDGQSILPAMIDHMTCTGLGLIVYRKQRHELRHAGKAWHVTLIEPCLISGFNSQQGPFLSGLSDHS